MKNPQKNPRKIDCRLRIWAFASAFFFYVTDLTLKSNSELYPTERQVNGDSARISRILDLGLPPKVYKFQASKLPFKMALD